MALFQVFVMCGGAFEGDLVSIESIFVETDTKEGAVLAFAKALGEGITFPSERGDFEISTETIYHKGPIAARQVVPDLFVNKNGSVTATRSVTEQPERDTFEAFLE